MHSPVTAPPPTSNGHAPHSRRIHAALYCALQPSLGSIALVFSWKLRVCFSYSLSSYSTCQFTGLPPDCVTHVYWSITLRGRLPRGRGRKFEQVCACVCQPHGRGFLAQCTSREGSCDWCGERGKAILCSDTPPLLSPLQFIT